MYTFQVENEMFGVDWDGPLPDVICDSHVEVSCVESPLMIVNLQNYVSNSIADSKDHGMDIYLNCLEYILGLSTLYQHSESVIPLAREQNIATVFIVIITPVLQGHRA